MTLPINHRIDHEPTFVSPRDSAWDQERIRTEELEIADGKSETWKTLEEHPITRYWSGESRGDLSTVVEYLRKGACYTLFRLRRLPLRAWAQVQQLRERGESVESRYTLVRLGVVAVENADLEITPGKLSDEQIDAIRRVLGDSEFMMLSNQVYRASHETGALETFL
jgi:hypothetical protein